MHGVLLLCSLYTARLCCLWSKHRHWGDHPFLRHLLHTVHSIHIRNTNLSTMTLPTEVTYLNCETINNNNSFCLSTITLNTHCANIFALKSAWVFQVQVPNTHQLSILTSCHPAYCINVAHTAYCPYVQCNSK